MFRLFRNQPISAMIAAAAAAAVFLPLQGAFAQAINPNQLQANPPGRPNNNQGRPNDGGSAPRVIDGCCHKHKVRVVTHVNGRTVVRYMVRWHCHGEADAMHCGAIMRRHK